MSTPEESIELNTEKMDLEEINETRCNDTEFQQCQSEITDVNEKEELQDEARGFKETRRNRLGSFNCEDFTRDASREDTTVDTEAVNRRCFDGDESLDSLTNVFDANGYSDGLSHVIESIVELNVFRNMGTPKVENKLESCIIDDNKTEGHYDGVSNGKDTMKDAYHNCI